MTTPLLTTKLTLPPVRPELVPRPHLSERLNAAMRAACKLTLISAPPGFGKTTLLSHWAHSSGERVAWLSLDKGDDDPARFWTYVVFALQALHDELGESVLAALRSRQPPSIESIPTALINELAALPAAQPPLVLVLDDYHLVETPSIHEGLAFLVERLPAQLRLILSSRADPPWPLARLRARREIAELRAGDLRFTPEEASAFLNQVMRLNLSADDVAALEARTEGWVAGLQMAALSMQGRQDRAEFIRAFRGSHHFVLDYLVEEVLERQDREVQDFLLQTCLLERMTASLCDAVTGREGSQAILVQLQRANLFLIALDDERRWYRYHHLFAELLQHRLKQNQPELVPKLQRRASDWYRQSGFIAESVGCALAAGDMDRVASLVQENALPMIYHGELTTLVRWLAQWDARALPDQTARSWLCVAHAWAQAYSGQLDAVEPRLEEAEQALSNISSAVERKRALGHIAGIRGYCAMFKGDLARTIELTREALNLLPENDWVTRGFTMLVLGTAMGTRGNVAQAARTLTEAVGLSQSARDPLLTMMILSDLVAFQHRQGRLRQAAETCHHALRLADEYARTSGQRSPVVSFACMRLGALLYEWNDLEAALRYARQAFELSTRWGQKDCVCLSHSTLALILEATGDTPGALDAMRQAMQLSRDLPVYETELAARMAWLHLIHGNVAEASRWAGAAGLSVEDIFGSNAQGQYLTYARLLIAQGKPEQAFKLLERQLRLAAEMEAGATVIRMLALQTLALEAQGRPDQALTVLERALTLAAPEGYVRLFVDLGQPMRLVLTDLRARFENRPAGAADLAAYLDRLLAAMPQAAPTPPGGTSIQTSALVEPLSERELQVLQLLSTELSSADMADELYVSVNTVRSHIKSIYEKLGAHSRLEAIRRAEELGLL